MKLSETKSLSDKSTTTQENISERTPASLHPISILSSCRRRKKRKRIFALVLLTMILRLYLKNSKSKMLKKSSKRTK
jgi:hypothetical protein